MAAWLDELPTHSNHRQLDERVAEQLSSDLRGALRAVSGATMAVRYETFAVAGLRS